jgi:hypothetical protein
VDPRHAREYTPRDVIDLLEAAGFAVEQLETGSYGQQDTLAHEWVKYLLKRYQLPDPLRGDVIHAVGKKTGGVAERYPAVLYAGGAG